MNLKRIARENPVKLLNRLIKIVLLRIEIGKRRSKLAKAGFGKQLIQKEVHGSKMFLNPEDEGLSTELLVDGTREMMATNEFMKRLKPGMVVADIGANIGYYAMIEARKVGKNGFVYAIEPVPENIELLNKNVEANNYKNIEVTQKAIGDKDGKVRFFLSRKSNLASMVKQRENEGSKEIFVDVTTLDKFMEGKRKPDFVRMDLEGYEFEILKGMKSILKKKNLGLFIEVHAEFMGKEKTLQLFKMLKENGFQSCKIIRDIQGDMKAIARFVSKDVLPEWGETTKKIEDIIREQRPLDGIFHIFTQK